VAGTWQPAGFLFPIELDTGKIAIPLATIFFSQKIFFLLINPDFLGDGTACPHSKINLQADSITETLKSKCKMACFRSFFKSFAMNFIILWRRALPENCRKKGKIDRAPLLPGMANRLSLALFRCCVVQ